MKGKSMGDGRCGVGFVRRLTAVLVALCLSVQVSAETVKAPLVTKSGGARPGVADFRLPEGVSLHSAPGGAHYLKIPVAHALALIRPAVKPRATLMADWATDERFAAVINGGFFIADRPVSLVVRDGETLAENIAAVTRNGVQLPAQRDLRYWGRRDFAVHHPVCPTRRAGSAVAETGLSGCGQPGWRGFFGDVCCRSEGVGSGAAGAGGTCGTG